MGDAEAEGAVREGRVTSGGEEEEEAVAIIYQDTVLSSKLRKAVRRATKREGGGCLLPDEQCTKTGQSVAEVLREKRPDMCVSPVENPACTAFKEYAEVPKTVPLDFTDDEVTWVTLNISGTAGTLVAEAIELRNWLLRFRCSLE